MAQTTAQRKRNQRARDRARLGDTEYKRIEAEKMRRWRASKPKHTPKRTTIINNQPQPQVQPIIQVQSVPQVQSAQQQPKARKKAPQQFQRVPQQVVKDYVPMYKSPNATPISDTSIATYLSQFKKVYQHFTQKKRCTR